MPDVVDVTRAELGKLTRRPAAWSLLATAVVLSQVFGYLIPYLSSLDGTGGDFTDGAPREQILAGMAPAQLVTNTTAAFPVFIGALALVLGALVAGGEYTGGTLKTLLTQGPRRASVLGGQLAALAIAMGLGVVVLALTGAATSLGIALSEDTAVAWPSVADLATGLGSGWAVVTMWAVLGAILAVLLRSVALPIGLGVVWILGIENLVSAVAGSTLTALQGLRDVLPGTSSGSLIVSVLPPTFGDLPPGVSAVVSGQRGLATVLAYLVVAVVAGVLVTRRRDVAT